MGVQKCLLFVVFNYRRVRAPVPAFPSCSYIISLQHTSHPPQQHSQTLISLSFLLREAKMRMLTSLAAWGDGQKGSEVSVTAGKKKKQTCCGSAASSWNRWCSRFGASMSCLATWRAFPGYSFTVPDDLWDLWDFQQILHFHMSTSRRWTRHSSLQKKNKNHTLSIINNSSQKPELREQFQCHHTKSH